MTVENNHEMFISKTKVLSKLLNQGKQGYISIDPCLFSFSTLHNLYGFVTFEQLPYNHVTHIY